MRWSKLLGAAIAVVLLAGCISRGSGTYTVGGSGSSQIPPGTYRTRTGTSACYWERLRGFGGTTNDIISNEFTNGPTIVSIAPTDIGFRIQGCALLVDNLSPIKRPADPTPPGQYFVGSNRDISPGVWRSPGGNACYWERQRGFSGEFRHIIANNFSTAGPVIVSIQASDAGFKQSGCWPFVKIG